MTKNPVDDQPLDIENQIKELVFSYIKNDNSIILAVTAANLDIATSEALKFAKEVDPDGVRTLAVLTKLDLMDEGTNAVDVLRGKTIPVKLGIKGVVNRSQKSIDDKKEMEEQLEKEAAFLRVHYPALARNNGTPFLGKMLSKLLMNHIRECLPGLKERVNSKTLSTKKMLDSYGKDVGDDQHILIEILSKFSLAYSATINGAPTTSGCGETRLYKIIHEDFDKSMKAVKSTAMLTESDHLISLSDAFGQRPTLFRTPSFDGPFESILNQQIVARLLEPSLNCIEMIRTEMQRAIENCGEEMKWELERFPKLRLKIRETVIQLLHSRIRITNLNIENIVKVETAYINKSHPDFNKTAILSSKLTMKDEECFNDSMMSIQTLFKLGQELSDEENEAVLVELIETYFLIVRKSIQDLTPKTIIHFLVNYVTENLQSHLIKHVYHPDKAEELMKEADKISVMRKEAKEMLEALTRASRIISDDLESA